MTGQGTPLEQARHADEETRYRGVLQLDGSRADQLAELLARLSDPSWRVRSAAVERLSALADPGPALPRLIDLLDGAEIIGGRAAAEMTLANLGAAALPALLLRLASSSGPRRLAAVGALGALGSRRSVPALVACLADPDASLRAVAAEALGKIGGVEAVGALQAALDSDDRTLRATALDALGALHVAPAAAMVARLMGEAALRPGAYRALAWSDEPVALELLGRGLAEPGRSARLAALASIGAQRVRRPLEALAPLAAEVRRVGAEEPGIADGCVAALESGEPQVAEGALLVLGWTGDLTHAPALARRAANDRLRPLVELALESMPRGAGLVKALGQVLPELLPVARVATFAALARAGEASALQALLEQAADPDPQVQSEAIGALGRLGHPAGATVLGGLLDDGSPALADLAAEALAAIGRGSEDGRRVVLLECRARAAAGGSAAIFQVLGACGEGEDLRLIRLGLVADSVARRVSAAAAVAALGKRGLLRGEHVPELIAALSDPDWPVRVAASRALAELADANFGARHGDPEAGEHPLCSQAMDGLLAALADVEPPVRAAAVEALGACGRPEHGPAVAALVADGSAPALVVVAALRALARLAAPEPGLLRGAMAHPDPEVAKAVVAATRRVPGEDGRELLRAALRHARWDVRLAAAQAIAARGDGALRDDTARAAAAESDPLVARALAEAALGLARIHGR
jgi:HEAT repeat protein